MQKYKITYTREQFADVIVEAADPDKARQIADSIFDPRKHYVAQSNYQYSDFEELDD